MPRFDSPAILQVLPALNAGGVERGTLEVAGAIAGAGFRPLVASAGGRLVPQLEALGARHVTLPLDGKSPLALWRNAGALQRLIAAEGVRIVHARSRFPAWSALWAARRAGARFVTTYHGTYNENFPGKRRYNAVMARGERVIAISRFIAELIRQRHNTDPARIRLIPRGVDTGLFDPAAVDPARIAALRAAWGVPEDRPVLLLPARISRWKGQGVLLEALARLPAPRPFALLLGDAGRGAFAAELRGKAASLGLQNDIAMPGHTDDLPAAFLLADLALHCSTDAEAFGRSVIEAQAMARPVIAADLGGPRETVRPGDTGWLVPPGDPAALAAAIARVLALPAEARAAIGAAARAEVQARYSTAAMQRATLDVYRELLP
ncbi:glycosyltransferase family 4 protein [Teichococcus vastitatis]|uniref:Glycosyltransferase family 4 protein n=1 Tax=Teichococcus vastitatis TaxID=2307076 RepID=A0ABS9W3K1_9PROT|nr:glycosyltransferase family 4 protein [Pseudoroseomonas vastitatis]MCI0753797.1 glycosyltransferase family 4 protein [Pseudoroseomonas vastitatis]